MPLSVDKPGDPLHDYSGFTASVWQCHGQSRGRLAIRSADPFDQPRIEPNYFAEEIDRKTVVAGLRMLRDIYRQKSFRDLWDIEMVPGGAVTDPADLWDFARTTGGTVFHCVGTCRTGSDRQSVLDPQLRVRGVEKSPRDRRLGDAADHLRKYQCQQPDDRGAGRRPDVAVVTACCPKRRNWKQKMDLISDSHMPKYAQIADIFRQRIARGIWTQGLRLPANELLASEFGVSRVTIRQAVDLLVRDGIHRSPAGPRHLHHRHGEAGSLAQGRDHAVRPRRNVPRHLAGDHQYLREPHRRTPDSRRWQGGGALRLHAPGALAQPAALLRDLDLSRRTNFPEISEAVPQGNGDSDPEGHA